MSMGLGASGKRLAISAGSLVLLSMVMSACAQLVLPDRTQLLGTWTNFETNAALDLAEDGTCHVTGLPRGVEDGMGPPYGEPYSADCTWQLGGGGGGDSEPGESGATVMTVSVDGGGDMTVVVLRGPKLGVRQGTGADVFVFERALL
nr:hypothetical protein [Microbacterium bovistercoris]